MRAATAKVLVRGVLLAGLAAAMSGCVYGPAPAPYAYNPYYGSYAYPYGYALYYGGYYYGGPSVYFGGGWGGEHEHGGWGGGHHWH